MKWDLPIFKNERKSKERIEKLDDRTYNAIENLRQENREDFRLLNEKIDSLKD